MKFLIFGGTGFIGRSLVRYLKEKNQEVVSVSRTGAGGGVALDVTLETDFSELNFSPDVVINCASKVPERGRSVNDPSYLKELFLTNVVGAINIANWAVKQSVPRILNCSTLAVVKKPWPNLLNEETNSIPDGFHVGYSMSKLSQERVMDECVKLSGIKLVHVRLSAVYGDGMVKEGIIFNLINQLKLNEEVVLHDSHKNTLDLIHVHDICRSLFEISKKQIAWNYINLANGNPVTINTLARTLKKILHSKSKIVNVESNNPPSEANIDISKLREIMEVGFNDFIPLEEGLMSIIKNEAL
ncbi:NAD-dependent epimerase/dehydratase family protein [Salegentibacter sp. HM20]